jgi:hypothetical protein
MSHRRKRELVALAKSFGYRVHVTRLGRLQCRHPNGSLVHVAAIDGDLRQPWLNAVKHLRRGSSNAALKKVTAVSTEKGLSTT